MEASQKIPAALSADSTQGTPSQLPNGEDVRAIGEIIRDTRQLTAKQVEEILAYQRANDVRFGEAAIALNLATHDDVLRALSMQFNYAFGSAERQKVSPELVALNQPFGHQAEAFRALRAQIMLRTNPAPGEAKVRQAIAIVSPDTGDGKTFFCSNLAVALAQLGGRTLVVDGDLRGPRLHEVFSVPNNAGLSGLLSGRPGASVIKPVKGVPNLFVLPVGVQPPNPTELVEGPAFGVLLQELQRRFDHIIVDTPAGVFGIDSAVIAARCGVALVVARTNHVRVDALQDMVQMLTAASATVAGVVMNEF